MRKQFVLGEAACGAVALPTFGAGNLPTNRFLRGLQPSRGTLRNIAECPLFTSVQLATQGALEVDINVRVVIPMWRISSFSERANSPSPRPNTCHMTESRKGGEG
jgi:hypothetical protein